MCKTQDTHGTPDADRVADTRDMIQSHLSWDLFIAGQRKHYNLNVYNNTFFVIECLNKEKHLDKQTVVSFV